MLGKRNFETINFGLWLKKNPTESFYLVVATSVFLWISVKDQDAQTDFFNPMSLFWTCGGLHSGRT